MTFQKQLRPERRRLVGSCVPVPAKQLAADAEALRRLRELNRALIAKPGSRDNPAAIVIKGS